MPKFSVRSSGIEIMDDLNCSGEVVHQTLRELDTINQWLGGNNVTLKGVYSLLKGITRSISVVDLGCGSGEMLKNLSKKLSAKNPNSQFIGIDANSTIVSFATHHVAAAPNVTIDQANVLSEEFAKKKYDVILATLFLHHFTSNQLIDIFSDLSKQATIGIVVNDLHRHWFAYYSIKWITRVFSKSPMVKYDAPLSVLRGFRKDEIHSIMHQARISNYSLKWRWAFRWQLIIRTSN